MRSMIFLFLMIFSFGAGANTNGGGVFALKTLKIGPNTVALIVLDRDMQSMDKVLSSVVVSKDELQDIPGFMALVWKSYDQRSWVQVDSK